MIELSIQAESREAGMNFHAISVAGNQPFQPDDEVMPGVKWGRPEWVPSPAFWAALAKLQPTDLSLFRQPDSLMEEVAFCLLGGYGITAEVNCAAFQHLKAHGIFDQSSQISFEIIYELLLQKLSLNGAQVKYRFPRQRASRLTGALQRLSVETAPQSTSLNLREYLLTFDGIGPKTASWIVRNCTGADDVAIIDIHVHRAGLLMGLFSKKHTLPNDYFEMESLFLALADRISVRASILDALIWGNMRKLGDIWNDIGGMGHGERRRRRRRHT